MNSVNTTKMSLKKYIATIKKARLQVKQAGIKEKDVKQSIKAVRAKKR